MFSSNDLIVGASGNGSDNVLKVILVIVHEVKDSITDANTSKNIKSNELLDLSCPENFMPSGENSYMDLGAESKGSNRVRFAYTPPAPSVETITPEMKESLLEAAASQEPSRKKRKEIKQEMLPLEVVSKGRFEKSEPTIHKGEDLDQPTYIRRGMLLN